MIVQMITFERLFYRYLIQTVQDRYCCFYVVNNILCTCEKEFRHQSKIAENHLARIQNLFSEGLHTYFSKLEIKWIFSLLILTVYLYTDIRIIYICRRSQLLSYNCFCKEMEWINTTANTKSPTVLLDFQD